jgi:hypothetical protein
VWLFLNKERRRYWGQHVVLQPTDAEVYQDMTNGGDMATGLQIVDLDGGSPAEIYTSYSRVPVGLVCPWPEPAKS